MGSFVFKWEHPASEVYVTGTFDEWKKTEKLEKVGDHFEKSVTLADASQKIYYKFVVDGNWVVNDTAPKEADESGNDNNVLTPEAIVKAAPSTTALLNSAAPNSTTALMAGEAPIETPQGGPGAFPETPAVEMDNKEFGVNPLPAAPGAINPINLAPGERIPEGLSAGSTTEHVKLDPESYEKSDALPDGASAFLSSAGPQSTTAALAADAPIETKVPAIVKESQQKANVDAEASGVAEEVKEKAAVEDELLEKVKEAPSTSEGTAGKGTEKTESTVDASEALASLAAAAAAAGAAAVAGAVAVKDTAVDKATAAATTAQSYAIDAAAKLPEPVKEKLPESVLGVIGSSTEEQKIEEISPQVPTKVKDSITEAGKDPEAAANTEAVEDKKAVEAELLKDVKPTEAVGAESKTESKPVAAAEKAIDKVEETVGTSSKTEIETTPAANGPETTAVTTPVATPEKLAASTSKVDESPATTEKKKKNRISTLFSKLKPGKKSK